MYENFWYENLKEREQHEDGSVNLGIILKRIAKKVSVGLDLSGLKRGPTTASSANGNESSGSVNACHLQSQATIRF